MTRSRLFSAARAAAGLFILAVVLPVSSALAAPAEQFPGLDGKWRHVRSPHFEIYSRTSESYARSLLSNLETMRASFHSFLELPEGEPSEITVYAFHGSGTFMAYVSDHYRGTKNLIGEYRGFHDRDVIALPSDESNETVRWVVYADLTRNLLRGQGSLGPSWLSQGLAMFFGNFDASSSYYLVGETDSLRDSLVRDTPTNDLESLFQVEEGRAFHVMDEDGRSASQKSTDLFHARCWVLMHYWYCGQKEVSVADVNRFVRYMLTSPGAADPERVRAKFTEIFKTDYAEMSRRVSRYMRAGRFNSRRLPLPPVPASATFTARQVDEVEMRERLADLRLRNRRDNLGRFVMLEALNGPRAARAAEVLGTDAIADGDDRRAQEYWLRAVEAGTTNQAVISLAARLEFSRWFTRYDYYLRLPEEKTALLRDLLTRCRNAAPEQLSYYEMLAWVEAAAAEPDIRNVNLVQTKLQGDRLNARALLSIALVRARLGDTASALKLLAAVEGFRPTQAERNFARQVRRVLNDPELEASSDDSN